MKKISFLALAAAAMITAGCGSTSSNAVSNVANSAINGAITGAVNGVLGGDAANTQQATSQVASQATSAAGSVAQGALGTVLSAVTNGQTIGNVLQSVLGLDKLTKDNLVGTWTYMQPGCAFTSEQLLAQAGGEAVATAVKEKLNPVYQKVGISSANTTITFKNDGTFSAKIAGKQLAGKWTFNEKTYQVTLQTLLLNINCYAKKNANGIGLLFESKKLLTVLQTMAAVSGNSSLQTIGDLSKNYDGLRMGFDFK